MENYTLDTAMQRIRDIAESLEKNEFDLELSLKLYEEGVHLVSFCATELNNAKQRITELAAQQEPEQSDE